LNFFEFLPIKAFILQIALQTVTLKIDVFYTPPILWYGSLVVSVRGPK